MSGKVGEYIVRRLTPPDAEGIPELATRVYGSKYFHPEVFNPEELLSKNRSGELTSAVAIDSAARVVGHCALERPDMERFAKVGEAMVLPEHRQHHLLERMGAVLLGEALNQDLAGLYAEPVTHHVFSQKSVEAGRASPTGFKLGAWSTSGFGLSDLPQRVTPVVYFRYFVPPPKRIVFVPDRHQEIAARIFAHLGREVEFGRPREPNTAGELSAKYDEIHQTGLIQVVNAGRDSFSQVMEAYRFLTGKWGVEAVFVDIFIDQPAAIPVCIELEKFGFFFSGVQPHIKLDRDLLRLQIQGQPIDLDLVQTASDFGRQILEHIGQERERIGS